MFSKKEIAMLLDSMVFATIALFVYVLADTRNS